MNLVESVFDTAKKFTFNSTYVDINLDNLYLVANDMKLEPTKEFPKRDISNKYKTCLLELVGDSINYCYWYGSANVRPLEAGTGKMFTCVEDAFEDLKFNGGNLESNKWMVDRSLDNLIKILSLERFPLLEERIKHLNELRLNGLKFIETVVQNKGEDMLFLLNSMVQIFPGYASDMFLKRALLFFCQLNRMFGWFEKDMHGIPVPSDYQIPKMLEHYNILVYDKNLKETIEDQQIIPKGSLAECEIRASTIIACQELCKATGWTTPQVDGYFWLRRKEATNPFHLTVTSDY